LHIFIDIVYIGVQNLAHARLTIEALNAGKHVLCEKPLGVNGKEVREMVKTAREKRRFLMEVRKF
jgi:predicted dehydrogenase